MMGTESWEGRIEGRELREVARSDGYLGEKGLKSLLF
jgi:hypothetical protein